MYITIFSQVEQATVYTLFTLIYVNTLNELCWDGQQMWRDPGRNSWNSL